MPRICQYIDRHGDVRRRVVEPYEPGVNGLGVFVEAIEGPDHQGRICLVERLSYFDCYSRHGPDPRFRRLLQNRRR